jgi:DNA-binding response OmpR family regulator
MSGLELLSQIRHAYEKPPLVVTMITAYGDKENHQHVMHNGANDFLTKPVDFVVLTKKISVLKTVITGWVNYFKIAVAKSQMRMLDEMVRTRLRICQWKQWKVPKARVKRLIKLGVKKGHIGKSAQQKLLEERELRNFQRTLQLLIDNDAHCKHIVKIIGEE